MQQDNTLGSPWPAAVQLSLTPVTVGLPDPETNVLLFLADGTSAEGFLTLDHDGPQWRDVCAEPLDDDKVVAWADLPARSTAATLDLAERITAMRGALKDACDLLDGWVITKCPKRFVPEHMQHIALLRKAGQL